MRSRNRYPSCPYCGTEFRYRTGCYGFGEKIHLQTEWERALDFGKKCTREVNCPDCGKRIRIGYECVMYSIAEKAEPKAGERE